MPLESCAPRFRQGAANGDNIGLRQLGVAVRTFLMLVSFLCEAGGLNVVLRNPGIEADQL